MTDNLIYCYDSTGASCTCGPFPSLSCRVVFQAAHLTNTLAGLNPTFRLYPCSQILAPDSCQSVTYSSFMQPLQVFLQTEYTTIFSFILLFLALILGHCSIFFFDRVSLASPTVNFDVVSMTHFCQVL